MEAAPDHLLSDISSAWNLYRIRDSRVRRTAGRRESPRGVGQWDLAETAT